MRLLYEEQNVLLIDGTKWARMMEVEKGNIGVYDMNEDKMMQELLKDALARLKEHTLYELMEKDVSYKESRAERETRERKYMELKKHLPEKVTGIFETYLDAIDQNHTDENDLHYMAGVMDAIRLLASYGLLSK